MSDDEVEATLTALEARLHALQEDLAGAGVPGAGPVRAGRADGAQARPAAVAQSADPLEQFGVELRRLATELVAAWERVVAHERRTAPHRIVLEAQADLHALAALERALAEASAVRTLDLRAYAGGHASLVVEVS
jgi:hypothetical protein